MDRAEISDKNLSNSEQDFSNPSPISITLTVRQCKQNNCKAMK